PRNFGWGPDWAPSESVPPELSSSHFGTERSNVRILLLGDSQVGSRSDPQDLLPGKLLERALNARPAPFIKGEAACGTLPVLRKGYQSSSEISFEVDPPPLKWSDLRYVFDIQAISPTRFIPLTGDHAVLNAVRWIYTIGASLLARNVVEVAG